MGERPANHSVVSHDLLTSVLREARFESAAYRWLELGAPFRVRFDHPDLRGVHLVTRGACDLVLDDGTTAGSPTPCRCGRCATTAPPSTGRAGSPASPTRTWPPRSPPCTPTPPTRGRSPAWPARRGSRGPRSPRFTGRVGEPAMRYLQALRLRRARTLLGDQRVTVAAVAAQVGYTSDVAFAAAFKREFGVSPGAYRRSGVR